MVDAGLFTVGPMSESEARLAVTGPATEAGLGVEPTLVEAVVAELRDGAGGGLGSGVLPLMSQAMTATWQRREGNALTLRGYWRADGVADAVNSGSTTMAGPLTGGLLDQPFGMPETGIDLADRRPRLNSCQPDRQVAAGGHVACHRSLAGC